MNTIFIPSGCKPSQACSRDDTYPKLHHAWLRRRGDDMWLMATDSYVAVALKVEAKGDVQEGWVPYKALRRLERGKLVGQLSPTAWCEAGLGYTEVKYDLGARMDDVKVPDFDKIADGRMWDESVDPDRAAVPFGVNPEFLRRLGQAMGVRHAYALHIHAGDPEKAIAVLTVLDGRRGLIMPVSIERERNKWGPTEKAAA